MKETVKVNYCRNKFSAESIGGLALQRLRRSRCWHVIGVYRCCFYCQDDTGEIICIGTNRIDRGPFTLSGKSFECLMETNISVDDVLFCEHNRICFNDFYRFIEIGHAKVWNATFRLCAPVWPSLDSDIESLIMLSRREAPAESLGQLIPCIFSSTFTGPDRVPIFSQLLHDKLLGVMRRISEDTGCEDQQAFAVNLAGHLFTLIGTGYGLTPSGDDFCCGVVLGIALLQKYQAAESLAISLWRKAEGRTTAISLAYFKSLAESRVSETQAWLLGSFGNSGEADLQHILRKTASHGSTSGWDMLTGFAFGLQIVRAKPETADVEIEEGCIC